MGTSFDVIVIGGGQAGQSAAYFLRRTGLSFVILDGSDTAGGAWTKTWNSLHLFSPVDYSSIAGWQMPQGADEYPHKDEFVAYLAAYEDRYDLPVERPVHVTNVSRLEDGFIVRIPNAASGPLSIKSGYFQKLNSQSRVRAFITNP